MNKDSLLSEVHPAHNGSPRRPDISRLRVSFSNHKKGEIMKRKLFYLIAAVAGVIAAITALPDSRTQVVAASFSKPSAEKVILFASDGMRQDLMEAFADEGAMPTYAHLMRKGVVGANGLVQAFPPNTGVGWVTLATGTYPGEHGSTNNTFHRTGEGNFNNSTSFAATGILQTDTIAQAAERAGKTVVSMEWAGSRNITPTLSGPVVDF